MERSLRLALKDLPRLPGARLEARTLRDLLSAGNMQVTLLLDGDATATALLHLKAPAILHLATHGVFYEAKEMDDIRGAGGREARSAAVIDRRVTSEYDPRLLPLPDNPLLRSVLVLAATKGTAGGDDKDGLVTALEVAGMDLRGTQLVVLSACDTGRGDVRPVQGVYGLRRAFLIAGAETVVASLWRVNDEVTRELIVSYYRNLLGGQGRVQAMERASQAMRSKHPEPHYWAPFLVIGRDDPLR